MAYATLADVRSWLGVYDGVDDTELDLARNAATDAVTAWCGINFDLAAHPTARVFTPVNRYLLDLSAVGCTIGSTTGLAVAVDDDDNGTFEVAWASTDWQVEPLNSIGVGGIAWPGTHLRAVGDYRWPVGGSGRARVQVTARWGWPAVPTGVKVATIMLTVAWHQRRATMTGRSGVDGFFAAAITDDQAVQDLLAPYRAGTAMTGIG